MSRSQHNQSYKSSGPQLTVPKAVFFEDDKNVSSFIGKLSVMLQDPAAQPFVCWSQSGESILIIDPARFSSQILPRYFKHSNFASFVRQLNLYGFHKTSQESDTCEFSHPVFRQGNEHTFKDIRRKVSSQSSFSQDKDSVKSKSEMDKMMQSIEELKNRQAEFEKALEQKEAEKMMIYQEMIQSKHRQDILEARMARMVGVLMTACHSIGLTQLEGEGCNSLLQIMDGMDTDPSRSVKRQRLIENSPSSGSTEIKPVVSFQDGLLKASPDELGNSVHSEMMTSDFLDALSAKFSGSFEKLRTAVGLCGAAHKKPTLEDVTDRSESSFVGIGAVNSENVLPGYRLEQDALEDSLPGVSEASPVFPAAHPAHCSSGGLQSPGVAASVATVSEGDALMSTSLLLSPRGFDTLEGLPTEGLNSIELNLGSQSFTLDGLLSTDVVGESPAAGDKVGAVL